MRLAATNYNKGVDYCNYNKLKYNTTIYRPLYTGYFYILYTVSSTLRVSKYYKELGFCVVYKKLYKVGPYAIVRQFNRFIIKFNKQLGRPPNLLL